MATYRVTMRVSVGDAPATREVASVDATSGLDAEIQWMAKIKRKRPGCLLSEVRSIREDLLVIRGSR